MEGYNIGVESQKTNMVKLQSETKLPTKIGSFKMMAFSDSEDDPMPHVVFSSEKFDPKEAVLLRIHSECMTGDVFNSLKCDCGDQLDFSLNKIVNDNGIVLYLRQEGRGIGLIEKLKAYKLQEAGMDTVEANRALGHGDDQRDYTPALDILSALKVKRVKLMTNNPLKIKFLNDVGIEVVERVPIILPTNKHSEGYFETKRNKMGHMF